MLKVAIAQVAPVLLDREATLEVVVSQVGAAAGAGLLAFGEAFVPGYPMWLCRTDAARFDDHCQKEMFARSCAAAVTIEDGHLEPVTAVCRRAGIALVLGIVERPRDRGGHSLYCSRVFIDGDGVIRSVHRKLMPTYEERLTWGVGDGAGLVTHRVGPFTLGALNCWENWMPLARAALYAQGEDLHIALWPGGEANTRDITRMIALESRSYVVSASALLRLGDIPPQFPMRDRLVAADSQPTYNGGSCIAGPDGRWVVEPVVDQEGLIVAELDPARVSQERQNFDPAGHYARPDVLRLHLDRTRQSTLRDD